ncbi:hypothetical protein [Rhodoflexus caldus]|uniref:hypothetical protein n=1 Tax=Rhodoflexus caldus TaxID=2891236 RepID=UPI00202A9FFF|nr:hypothetical protein [Rhodoflexus caldus]
MSNRLFTHAKQLIVWLFLFGFIAQLNGEFVSVALSFIHKKAIEQVSDDLNIESEANSDDVQDIVSLKKSKGTKKLFPLDYPLDVSYLMVVLNRKGRSNFNDSESSSDIFFHPAFLKTPRYIAFQSLIFYER